MMYHIIFFSTLLLIPLSFQPRSPRRNIDSTMPSITVSSTNPKLQKTWASRHSHYVSNKKNYKLQNNFLRLKPIKHGFDINFFNQHYIPNDIITYRDNSGIVHGATLAQLATDVIEEIKVGQRHFTN